MSQRYFLTTESTYEALRLSVDADLGYPTATASSIFTPALQAPRDSLRRIVLAVDTALPGYPQVVTRVTPLLANSSVQELTEAEYLAFLACVPTTTDAIPFSQVSDTATFTNFLPSGGDLGTALSGIDSVLSGKAASSHTHLGLLSNWKGYFDQTTNDAGGYTLNDLVCWDDGLYVWNDASPSSSAWQIGDLVWTQISTYSMVVSIAGKSGVVTLGPSDVGAAALSHAHSASDITSGTVDTARLGSGTASSSTFLRGDGTWASAGSTSASDLTSGTLNAARLPSTTVTAASYGSASAVATFTVDATGRLTAAGSTSIAISAGAVSGLATIATSGSASDLGSGTVPVGRLGSSGTASSSTFLRGDNTWATAGSSSASDLTSGTLSDSRLSTNAQAAINLYLWSSFR